MAHCDLSAPDPCKERAQGSKLGRTAVLAATSWVKESRAGMWCVLAGDGAKKRLWGVRVVSKAQEDSRR